MSQPAAKALKRVCMRDHIRDTLVGRILDGTYPAGTQLKELYLAREFDVSQAPIREALRELEGSGLVSSEPFRGTRVRGADFAEMRESYELRTMLEMRSVVLAAPYKPDLLADLGGYLREMDVAGLVGLSTASANLLAQARQRNVGALGQEQQPTGSRHLDQSATKWPDASDRPKQGTFAAAVRAAHQDTFASRNRKGGIGKHHSPTGES